MLNYFLRLRRKKGFTLVELIIVVAILGVLMVSVAALSDPIRRMVNRTSATADATTANTIMGNYIENRLGFASYIDMYCAVNARTAAGSTSFNTTFNSYAGMLGQTGNEKDKAGVMIFHYASDSVEPEKSHYEIYDFPITSTSTSYGTSVLSGTVLNSDYTVFADDFYAFSQNMFIAPTEVSRNKIRNDVYMSIDIIPYTFNSDMMVYDGNTIDTTVDQYISPTKLQEYYEYKFNRDAEIAAGGAITYTDETCGLGVLDGFRAGPKETLTFELQNILAIKNAGDSTDLDDRFKVTNCAEGGSSILGSDIVIFYYISHF